MDLTAVHAKIDAIANDLAATKEALAKAVDLISKIPAGAVGKNGADGKPGVIGERGPQGVAGLDGKAGPVGPAGERGPQGVAGPAGSAADLGPLLKRIAELESRTFTAELYDADGKLIQTVPFSSLEPLRLKLVPLK